MTTTQVFTRRDYMNTPPPRDEAHRRYYAQLVDDHTIRQVVQIIGDERLSLSTDPHFNDIPLRLWDGATIGLHLARSFSDLGDYPTLAGLVCVAKEAARQFVEKKSGPGRPRTVS